MRAQTILFLLVDRVREKLDCRPYRDGGEGNPKRLGEAASLAFPTRSFFLTIRDSADVSDVALLKRIGNSERWLRSLCIELLQASRASVLERKAGHCGSWMARLSNS